MANELFFHHFEEVAKDETRTLHLLAAHGNIPADSYAYFESYCTDPTCDCRRVLLHVTGEKAGIVAVIGYAFDRNDPMPGPYIDPLNKRAPYAEGILKLTREMVLSDPSYVARLERHYRMMKEKFGSPRLASGSSAPRKKAKKQKSNKRKKRRRPS